MRSFAVGGGEDEAGKVSRRVVPGAVAVARVERLPRAQSARRREAVRVDVDGDQPARLAGRGPRHDERADPAGADDHAGLPRRQPRAADRVQRHRERLRHGGRVVGHRVRDRAADRRRRDDVLGQPAVDLQPQRPVGGAQIRAPGFTPLARPARDARPRHDARAGPQLDIGSTSDNAAGELVPEHDGRAAQDRALGQLGGIGGAERRPRHLDHHLAGTRRARVRARLDPDVARAPVHRRVHALMWTFTLVAVSRAASSASSADASGNRAVTIAVGSAPPEARKRIVAGHSPADPMIPCSRSAFDWIRPRSAETDDPIAIPTKTTRAEWPASTTADAIAAGAPAASMTTSKPRPAVTSATASEKSAAVGSSAASAPSSVPRLRRWAWGSTSTTRALHAAAAITHSRPIGPPPITATVSLGSTRAAAIVAL